MFGRKSGSQISTIYAMSSVLFMPTCPDNSNRDGNAREISLITLADITG